MKPQGFMSRATNVRETASVSVLLEAILPLRLFLAFRRMIMVYNPTHLLRCRKELITH